MNSFPKEVNTRIMKFWYEMNPLPFSKAICEGEVHVSKCEICNEIRKVNFGNHVSSDVRKCSTWAFMNDHYTVFYFCEGVGILKREFTQEDDHECKGVDVLYFD